MSTATVEELSTVLNQKSETWFNVIHAENGINECVTVTPKIQRVNSIVILVRTNFSIFIQNWKPWVSLLWLHFQIIFYLLWSSTQCLVSLIKLLALQVLYYFVIRRLLYTLSSTRRQNILEKLVQSGNAAWGAIATLTVGVLHVWSTIGATFNNRCCCGRSRAVSRGSLALDWRPLSPPGLIQGFCCVWLLMSVTILASCLWFLGCFREVRWD